MIESGSKEKEKCKTNERISGQQIVNGQRTNSGYSYKHCLIFINILKI